MTSGQKRSMPKGGRTGGSQFPRSTLDEALKYARKLVVKTHVTPISRDVVYAGVVGAKSGLGNMRISALKQYGLLAGTADAYKATEHAKKAVAAPPEELVALCRESALRPAILKAIFHTFNGDTVSRAKLRQRAAELQVHPDQTEACVDIYLSTMRTAKLVQVNGDQVIHLAHSAADGSGNRAGTAQPDDGAGDGLEIVGEVNDGAAGEQGTTGQGVRNDATAANTNRADPLTNSSPRAIFNVNVTLDSSLDTDKLEKQLQLLKRFGAL